MCQCKTCAVRLQLLFLIHLLPVSWGCYFHTHAFRSLLRIFYALPIVHDTSSKNVKLSSATTSFPWRHTNTCKDHGYNAVADDSRQVSFAATSFPWRDTNTCKDHGYNAVADDSRQLSSATTWRHTNTRNNPRITDVTLWRKCLAPAVMLCPGFCTHSLQRRLKR